MFRLIAVAALVSALSLEAQDAKLYVYRYSAVQGRALRPSVFCDGNEVVRISSGRVAEFPLSPGTHEIHSNDKQAGTILHAESGGRYYVRIDIAVGVWKGHGRVVNVPPEQGAFEVQKLKPVNEDKIGSCAAQQ